MISDILKKVETDKIWYHRYGDCYDTIFSKFDRNLPLNILEIGTQKGGTLLAWKEYFPNANVYGVDIVDEVLEEYRVDTVTRIISDIKDWKNDTMWDIVIDDGSHYLPDVVFVINQSIDKLNIGGVLIIEDVRFPNLLAMVIKNIFDDRGIAHLVDHTVTFEVNSYDNRKVGNEVSYIITIKKYAKNL